MANNVELTAEEQSILDDIVSQLPGKNPRTVRDGLAQGEMVFVKDAALQKKIEAFRAKVGDRVMAEYASRSFVAPTRTDENSWEPSPQEEALISAFLQTIPPEGRGVVRDRLMRNNTRLTTEDPKGKNLLAQIYKARHKRWTSE